MEEYFSNKEEFGLKEVWIALILKIRKRGSVNEKSTLPNI
jgi:hypothetical protein